MGTFGLIDKGRKIKKLLKSNKDLRLSKKFKMKLIYFRKVTQRKQLRNNRKESILLDVQRGMRVRHLIKKKKKPLLRKQMMLIQRK